MPIGDLLASISGEPSPTTTSRPLLPTKRKSYEGEGTRHPAEKQQKTNITSSGPPITSRPSNPSTRPTGVDTSMSRMKLNNPPGPNSRPLPPKTAASSSKPQNCQPTPPTNVPRATAPPKKGSFAEIMARGKQAQSTMGQVGKIQHKRIEKTPSKRERADIEAQKAVKIKQNIGPNGKFRNTPGAAAINSKTQVGNGKTNGKSAKAPEPEKKIKKAALATTGYAGTARPKPGAKPGSKLSSHASSSRAVRDHYGRRLPPLGSRQDRYDSYEDDEEDEEGYGDEDDQPDYESDVSSDMEAAAFEVDEEEEFAAKVARKEDAEALAEENRLKKEKAEKKKRLMAMAAKAGKKR